MDWLETMFGVPPPGPSARPPWTLRRRAAQRVRCLFGHHLPGARITSDPLDEDTHTFTVTATWCPMCLGFYDPVREDLRDRS